MSTVYIVIVNWNGQADTSVCLDSLRRLNPRGCSIHTIVVDNASTDNSVSMLKKKYPWATVLVNDENLGFSGGNNVGMRYAHAHRADFIWLLNNDTYVDPDALSLVDAFDREQVGIAGSKIYFAPGHEYHGDRYTKPQKGKVFWYAGGLIDWRNMYASHRGVDEVDRGQYDTVESTPFVTGCSMMISRRLIDRIGMLDDKYFLYLEDLDYCMRAGRAGFALRYFPRSIVWHVNAGSSGGAGNMLHEYYQTRNRVLFASRYAGMRTKLAVWREAIGFVLSRSDVKKKAILDAFFGRWGNQYESKKSQH